MSRSRIEADAGDTSRRSVPDDARMPVPHVRAETRRHDSADGLRAFEGGFGQEGTMRWQSMACWGFAVPSRRRARCTVCAQRDLSRFVRTPLAEQQIPDLAAKMGISEQAVAGRDAQDHGGWRFTPPGHRGDRRISRRVSHECATRVSRRQPRLAHGGDRARGGSSRRFMVRQVRPPANLRCGPLAKVGDVPGFFVRFTALPRPCRRAFPTKRRSTLERGGEAHAVGECARAGRCAAARPRPAGA